MASQTYINNLKELENRYKSLDLEKLTRKKLGEESLENEIQPRLDRISKWFQLVMNNAPCVFDNFVN